MEVLCIIIVSFVRWFNTSR